MTDSGCVRAGKGERSPCCSFSTMVHLSQPLYAHQNHRDKERKLRNIYWVPATGQRLCQVTIFFIMIFIFSIIVGLQGSVNFLLYSKVTQSHTHIYIHSFSHIIFHHALSQVTRYSFQCYAAGSRCLSIFNPHKNLRHGFTFSISQGRIRNSERLKDVLRVTWHYSGAGMQKLAAKLKLFVHSLEKAR